MLDKITNRINNMKASYKLTIKIAIGLLCAAILIAIFKPVEASDKLSCCMGGDTTVNNFSVTEGVSDEDLAKGMALSSSMGGHELDYGTEDHQFSLVYSLQLDEEEEQAITFKYGKRWKAHKYIPNALFHVTGAPDQGLGLGNWVMFGGTIRIK